MKKVFKHFFSVSGNFPPKKMNLIFFQISKQKKKILFAKKISQRKKEQTKKEKNQSQTETTQQK